MLLTVTHAAHAQEPEKLMTSNGEMPSDGFISEGLDRGGIAQPVREAMSRVPRHLFVPEQFRELAYDDRPVPIGAGQTVSQPYMVGLMTTQAGVKAGDKVLEVGTGSGYQAAVLTELGARVFSVEIVPELAQTAAARLKELGYEVAVRQGDGWEGWPEEGPFDAILVTAAAPRIPGALLKQLVDGGRLLVPVELANRRGERLIRYQREGEDLVSEDLGPVKFVPLTGEARATAEAEQSRDSVLERLKARALFRK